MTRLKKASLIGALLFVAVVLASASDAQASRRYQRGGAYRAAQYKTYHFTGQHQSNYVAPPYRFRKKIVPNASYRHRHVW